MNFEPLFSIIREHKGKTIGIILGFLFGIFTVIFGFWRTFFITICIGLGFYFGRKFDENDQFKNLLDKLLHK